jgi:hypothetical protein
MSSGTNRKLSANLPQLPLPEVNRRKNLPFRGKIFRNQRKKPLNRKLELPLPELKIKRA